MTNERERVRANLPILMAWLEGRTIQYRTGEGQWKDEPVTKEMPCIWNSTERRIKPEPSLRPWRPEEVPVGAWIRHKGYKPIYLISVVGLDSFSHPTINSYGHEVKFDTALEKYEYSLDNGKTWHPCGVTES